jgi:hypothetical protein
VRGFGASASFLLVVLATLGAAYAMWWIIEATTAERLLIGDTRSNSFFLLASVAAALAFAVVVQTWLAPRLGRRNFALGQLVAFTVIAAAVTVALPEASYVFQWPLVSALLGTAAALFLKGSKGAAVAAFLGSVPAILIFAPLMYLLFVILGMDAISICVVAALLGLLLTVMAPLIALLSSRSSVRIALPILLVCCVAFAATGRQLSRFSPDHPRRNSVFYSLNADEQRAAWLSNDDAADDWTAQFLSPSPRGGAAPEFTAGSSRIMLSQTAERVSLEPPTAAVLSDTAASGGRTLKLHVASPRGANTLLLRFAADVRILRVAVDGREYAIADDSAASGPWLFRYNAVPPGGFDLELLLQGKTAVDCWLADRSVGMPGVPGATYAPRPADMMPTYGSDVTLVTRRYRF